MTVSVGVGASRKVDGSDPRLALCWDELPRTVGGWGWTRCWAGRARGRWAGTRLGEPLGPWGRGAGLHKKLGEDSWEGGLGDLPRREGVDELPASVRGLWGGRGGACRTVVEYVCTMAEFVAGVELRALAGFHGGGSCRPWAWTACGLRVRHGACKGRCGWTSLRQSRRCMNLGWHCGGLCVGGSFYPQVWPAGRWVKQSGKATARWTVFRNMRGGWRSKSGSGRGVWAGRALTGRGRGMLRVRRGYEDQIVIVGERI